MVFLLHNTQIFFFPDFLFNRDLRGHTQKASRVSSALLNPYNKLVINTGTFSNSDFCMRILYLEGFAMLDPLSVKVN